MHLCETFTNLKNLIINPPLGFPNFTEAEVKDANKIEVWGSSFADDGPDFCEFRVMKNNELILKKRVEGY